MLWKIFHESSTSVPPRIRSRVLAAYNDLGDRSYLGEGDNPVHKVPLGVAGVDAELVIEEIMGSDIGGEAADGDLRVCQGMERQEVRLLSSQLMHLRRKLSDTRAEID